VVGEREQGRSRRARLGRALGGQQLAVDLGTANTVVFRRDEGVVLFEPSVVAIDERTGLVHAVGKDAVQMIGRTPGHITASRPLRHGVVADFETTEQMLRQFMRKLGVGPRSRAQVVVCVPSGITQVERNAVEHAARASGARGVALIDEPLAGAIGAGLPVAEAVGSLVVDIGGGTSEMAVTALGGMVVSHSLRVGGYELDDAIVRLVATRQTLLIGQEQAEGLKLAIGAATRRSIDAPSAEVAGRDLVTGLLRRATIDAGEVQAALSRPLGRIVDAVTSLLERTPPELSADISSGGLTLVGGGALLRGFDDLLHTETGLVVTVADAPLTAVARGAGAALEELDVISGGGRRGRR
jgi:rod shape-determining protein MreB